jgi:hypothetical protein
MMFAQQQSAPNKTYAIIKPTTAKHKYQRHTNKNTNHIKQLQTYNQIAK